MVLRKVSRQTNLLKLWKDKKGAVTDTIYVPMYLVGIAITIFIGLYIWGAFRTSFADLVAPTPYNSTIVQVMNNIQVSMASFDFMFPLLVIGLLIISLIFAYKTGASVIYTILSFILWGLAMMMSIIFTNIFGEFESAFPSVSTTLSIIPLIMNNMKWIVLFWVFLISVVMFTRNKREEQQISATEAAFGSGGGMYG